MTTCARVLITGADGFVGRHLARHLAASNSSCRLILAGGPQSEACDLALDVVDAAAMARAVRESAPDAVVHLAAVSAVGAAVRDPRRAWDVNSSGTLNLALAMQEHVPHAQLLYVSSAEVYGATLNEAGLVDETAALLPLNPYAASKAAAEVMLGQMARAGMKVTIARPFNHIGPGQSEAFALPSFAAQIAAIEAGAAEPVIKVGNLDDERDFTDVEDVVAAYAAMLAFADRLEAGAVFNLASERSHRIGDLLDLLLGLASVAIRVEVDPTRVRGSGVRRVEGRARKAAKELGWSPAIPIKQTLSAVLEDARRRQRERR